jgi:hypothetical protein
MLLARLKAGQRGASAVEVEDLAVALILEDQGGFRKELTNLPAFRSLAAQPDPRPRPPFLPVWLTNYWLE